MVKGIVEVIEEVIEEVVEELIEELVEEVLVEEVVKSRSQQIPVIAKFFNNSHPKAPLPTRNILDVDIFS